MTHASIFTVAALLLGSMLPPAIAGEEVRKPTPPPRPAAKSVIEKEEPFRSIFPEWPAGSITLGAQFSEHNTGAYLDSITGLWTSQSRNSFLFLNSRYHYEDNDQLISSIGLGFRQMVFDGQAIIGANVYWDAIHSANNHDYDQLGLGVEVLTTWVDFRFNYYLPEDDQYEIGRSSRTSTSSSFGPAGLREVTTTEHFRRYEAGLEGFNTEIGFLVPGVERFADVRLFAGYYHYDNPFGDDYDGFKGRLEARVLKGVTFDVEYWDDEALNGGHWTGGVRVSLPFTFANVFTGKNPFEGAGEMFKPASRDLKDRMGEMVLRSHRIQTVGSGNIPAGSAQSVNLTPLAQQESTGVSRRRVATGSGGFPIE